MNHLPRLLAKLCVAAVALAAALPAVHAAPPAKRPNILLIVADDLGYTDLGAYGGEIATPNLDRLAAGGAKLTGFYASPFCSPTRAMLMSGSDNHLVGFGDMAELMLPEQRGKPGYEGYLNERVVPMGQVLKDAGYRTVMAGKWHLGVKEEMSPAARGFERSFAMVQGGASHWGDQSGIVALDPAKPPKAVYREDGKSVELPREGFYSSEAFATKLIDYLKADAPSGKPFFAYLAFTAPHWPLHAPDEDIAKYADRYKDGYDALRRARLERMKALGLIAADTPVYEGHPYWPKWESLSAAQKLSEARRMAVYAAMVDNMDRQIGRVLDYLKQTGELDNTFVFFMSDNGADGNSVYDVAHTREWIHHDMDNSTPNLGRPGSFAEYGPGWAQVGMTPFKLYKSMLYEGGISVPAIAWGPGIEGGSVKREFADVMDVAPTVYELAGAKHPGTSYQGREVLPLRGKSMLAYLENGARAVHGADEAIGWELGGRKALRKGDWKIVYANKPWGSGEWELYNIAKDRTESENLAARHPEKLKELLAAWRQYVAETGTLEIEGLASRPGYSNGGKYYEDLALEAATTGKAEPRSAAPGK
ncbi:sulfatase-like hydrolase/transferase [Aromatoleum toluvorans]|uniref:Sulfatase-like hydrolase/transferase n=1 Tax=Aromatoleum toluvorans TaxID=92002 RepID=A0ABX1PUI3_9RHOO|nr:arylsulfatase [Aromatoleum toluvorans]NMG43018.1 sulfatase-like hydrolase/transferase [Aromatoleum toluvorans]